MINKEELRLFLNKADRPHADGTANIVREQNGSSTIEFADGEWRMNDNFYGGEPYGGRQVVYHKGSPVWMCVYYGWIEQSVGNVKLIYDFLRLSLQHAPVNGFSRGPGVFTDGKLEYKNHAKGDISNYSGKEVISTGGKDVYYAYYLGGLVDQRNRGDY